MILQHRNNRRSALYPKIAIESGVAFVCANGRLIDQARNVNVAYPAGVYTANYEDGRHSYWPDSTYAVMGSWAKDIATYIILCRPTFTYDAGSRSFAAVYMQNAGNELIIGYSAYSSTRSWAATVKGGYGTLVSLSNTGSITSNAQLQKPCTLILRYSVSGQKELWANGALVASSSTATSSFTSQGFAISGPTSTTWWKGGIKAVIRLDRYITDEEIYTYSRNPSSLFRSRVVFTPVNTSGLTISPSFISSVETFYTTTVANNDQAITDPNFIASAEAFFTHALALGDVTIVPQFIASGELVYVLIVDDGSGPQIVGTLALLGVGI